MIYFFYGRFIKWDDFLLIRNSFILVCNHEYVKHNSLLIKNHKAKFSLTEKLNLKSSDEF